MRNLVVTAALVGIVSVATSATAPQYAFAFTVRIDNASPVALAVSVPPGTSQMLQATEHLKVEIEAPVSTSDASMTIVKLIDDSSGKPVVLHTARRTGAISSVRTFGYAVCDGRTKFESPLQSQELECDR